MESKEFKWVEINNDNGTRTYRVEVAEGYLI